MKLVIIADDARVCVDSVCYDELSMGALDPTIHAVQWNGVYGEVEYKPVFENGQITKPQNQVITSIDSYQWAVDAWNVAKSAEAEAIAAARAEE
jgi:hypothetical protein